MPEVVLILIRSVLAFFVLLLMTRLMGKQQIAQLTFFDYVVGITIGSIAASLSMDQNIPIVNGIVSVLIWAGLPILVGIISLKSYRFNNLVSGRPAVLIKDGKINEKNLVKNLFTIEELMLALREKNAFRIADVEFAVLETNGKVSVMKKSDTQTVTPKDLELPVVEQHDPRIVIYDRNIMERTLIKMGYSKEWLFGEIEKQGARHYTDVFLAQLDSNGNLFVDLYKDQFKKPKVKAKPLVAASMQKIHSDLETFALETQNTKAKKEYEQMSKQMQDMIKQTGPYLKG